MAIDDRTANFNLPLPNQDNSLVEDVSRLRSAITDIDSELEELHNTNVTAGNGLAGGGNISGGVELSMGTPSTLSASTSNAVSLGTHTHQVDFPVTAVNSKTGDVTLTTTDVVEGSNLYYTNERAAAAAPVQSVAGKTGAVTLSPSDAGAEPELTQASQVEMEGGSESSLRSMSPLRVRQAINAVVGSNMKRSERTVNAQLVAADKFKLIDITSGTFTQTFASCASLGDGWYCIIKNSGSGDITLDPNLSETIDGLTSFVMYPGEARLIQCDGSVLRSVVLNAFYRVFESSGTFTKPPGYAAFEGILYGAGGGGGGARAYASNSLCLGGGGGGSGGLKKFRITSAEIGASETVTIGAGGAGGSGSSTTTGGSDGGTGGNSMFFQYEGFGGYGGKVGTSTNGQGGPAAQSTTGVASTAAEASSGGFGSGSSGGVGKSTVFGGGGGGGGVGHSASATVGDSGGDGGIGGFEPIVDGGGGVGATTPGANGGNGGYAQGGGGGGAGPINGNAGNGGNGGAFSGGGGAGGAFTGYTGGTGGNGGRGEMRIWGVI